MSATSGGQSSSHSKPLVFSKISEGTKGALLTQKELPAALVKSRIWMMKENDVISLQAQPFQAEAEAYIQLCPQDKGQKWKKVLLCSCWVTVSLESVPRLQYNTWESFFQRKDSESWVAMGNHLQLHCLWRMSVRSSWASCDQSQQDSFPPHQAGRRAMKTSPHCSFK